MERYSPPGGNFCGVRVIRYDHPDVRLQFTPVGSRQDFLQGVVGLRHHNRHPLEITGLCHRPAHGRPGGQLGELLHQVTGAAGHATGVKFKPEKEGPAERIGGVLLRLRDIRAVGSEDVRHGRDNPRPVRTSDQQAGDLSVLVIGPALRTQRAGPARKPDVGFHAASGHSAEHAHPPMKPVVSTECARRCGLKHQVPAQCCSS